MQPARLRECDLGPGANQTNIEYGHMDWWDWISPYVGYQLKKWISGTGLLLLLLFLEGRFWFPAFPPSASTKETVAVSKAICSVSVCYELASGSYNKRIITLWIKFRGCWLFKNPTFDSPLNKYWISPTNISNHSPRSCISQKLYGLVRFRTTPPEVGTPSRYSSCKYSWGNWQWYNWKDAWRI